MKQNICDYKGYDYKNEFWVNQNRKYEHKLELDVVHRLLKKHINSFNRILDAGCGFGRLIPAYKSLFKSFTLVDYAEHLLEQAKNSNQLNNCEFLKQSLYELKLTKKVDAIISIRTLHHLDDIDLLFNKYNEVLEDNGILILDIPIITI